MLHPVGNLPAGVYWRRRLLLIVVPVLLLVLLLWALFGGGSNDRSRSERATTSHSTASLLPTSAPTPAAASTPAALSTATRPARSSAGPPPHTTIGLCRPQDLGIEAATGTRSFAQQSRPTLFLQVTNTSAKPCRRDLADQQVLLRIQSGDARIWGSQDCSVLPGKDVVTLLPATPVRRGVVWSGRTSAPGCKGVRRYPQPGRYALYAQLAGQQSKPVAFTLTAPG